MIKIKSPLLDSENITLTRKIKVAELIEQWKNIFNIDISYEMKGNLIIEEYRCNETQLFFFKPDNVDGGSLMYEALQKLDWYYMPIKWEHTITIKRLISKSKVLEVGCAEGSFLEMCNNLGHEATGLELNKNAVLNAKKKGLSVYEMDLHQFANEKENYYDCVCSYQVLEHISNPKEFISSCVKILKPGGKLIFCVPNSDGLLSKDYNILDMPPHHMSRWNKNAFQSLTQIFPLRLNNVTYEPLAKYHWDWYLQVLKNELFFFRLLKKITSVNFTNSCYKKLFSFGFNKLIKGHTIYVEFLKLN